MAPTKPTTSGVLDGLTAYVQQKQAQAVATADEAVRPKLPRVISDELRVQVQMYFRMIGLRDFGSVHTFFAWAGDRIYIDPEKSIPVGIELCDEFKAERPYLFLAPTLAEAAQVPRARVFVDETHERHFYVGYMAVKFRPNEELTDPYSIAIAQQHGIQLREGLEKPVPPRPEGSAPSIVVAEEADRYVGVGINTVVFRAGEALTDPHKIKLARTHGVAISER